MSLKSFGFTRLNQQINPSALQFRSGNLDEIQGCFLRHKYLKYEPRKTFPGNCFTNGTTHNDLILTGRHKNFMYRLISGYFVLDVEVFCTSVTEVTGEL